MKADDVYLPANLAVMLLVAGACGFAMWSIPDPTFALRVSLVVVTTLSEWWLSHRVVPRVVCPVVDRVFRERH